MQKFLLLHQKVIPPQALSQKLWKFLQQKETLAVESLFSVVISGWTEQHKFLKKERY